MGIIRKQYLAGNIISCLNCNSDISSTEKIVSEAFYGHMGRAYLMDSVVNVWEGTTDRRSLTTGTHVVRNIYCSSCSSLLGWKYVIAYDESQKYKENKFLLEVNQVSTQYNSDN